MLMIVLDFSAMYDVPATIMALTAVFLRFLVSFVANDFIIWMIAVSERVYGEWNLL